MTVTFIQKGKVDDALLNLKINKKTESSFITNTYVLKLGYTNYSVSSSVLFFFHVYFPRSLIDPMEKMIIPLGKLSNS